MNNFPQKCVKITKSILHGSSTEVLFIDGPKNFIKMIKRKENMISDLLTGLEYHVY
jgi:hypothetical protein